MSDSRSTYESSSSSDDTDAEIDYYKREKLIELHKTLLKDESIGKESDSIKFRKTKIGFDGFENAINTAAEDTVASTLLNTRNELNVELSLGAEPMPQSEVWMSIEQFNVERAIQSIENFVSTWEMPSYWLHCVDLLNKTSDEVSDSFIFETKWSIPTKEKPIPRATASVFFTFEVSKIKPRYYPVEVSFSFECSRVVYKPGISHVTENMFENIIENKMLISDSVKF